MKKILALLCSAVLLFGGIALMSGCGSGDQLKVGVTNYPPMDYKDEESGKWIGFDAELAEKTFGEMGYTVKFVEINWNTKTMALETREIDVIWNGMTITDELKESILLSEPYMVNQQVLVIRKADSEKYKTQKDLEKVTNTIAYESGSAADNLLKEMTNIPEDKKLSMEKQVDTFLEVKTGSSDVAIVDLTLAQNTIGVGDYEDLMYVDVNFEKENFAVGFRKEDTEMCKKVNELLEKYKSDGTIKRLQEKYEII